MKKLMIAASAALCATVGFSDVTSANVVGYQNKEVGAFTLVGTTFQTLGVEEADMTLGAIGANSAIQDTTGKVPRYASGWNWAASYIVFFNAAGEAGKNLVYYPQCVKDKRGTTVTVGWYDVADTTYSTCLNDTQMCTLGDGFLVFGKEGGETDIDPRLVFNGNVKKAPTDIPVGAFTLAANCTPKNLTLGDLSANSAIQDTTGKVPRYASGWNWAASYIVFFDKTTGEAGKNLVYYPQCVKDKRGTTVTVGWYDVADTTYSHCLNAQPIEAGDGFLVFGKEGGATDIDPALNFPSAL